jgi:hypothetical protein
VVTVAKKLIETRFTYDVQWTKGAATDHNCTGSYLGRKPASVATLRRFLRTTATRYGWSTARHSNINITGSSESQWVSK